MPRSFTEFFRRKHARRHDPRRNRIFLENLESRTLLSTYTVSSIADPATVAANTLRWAVQQADAAGGSNTINFDPAVFAPGSLHIITLTQGALNLTAGNITLSGPSPATVAVSGNSTTAIFHVSSGVTASIIGLTITAGRVTASGGSNGGAVSNDGMLNLITCTISGNTATKNGGGIYNDGNLALVTSTVSGNSATTAGGGIYNDGTMTVANSTVASNTAPNGGGFYANAGNASIINGTIASNTATATGNDLFINNANSATLAINNTIVAGKLLGGDVSGSLISSSSNNLIDDTTGGLVNGIGGATGNILNTGAFLRYLSNNGGPTATIALLPGSPAIDAGNNSLMGGATTDQRGYIRTANGTVDIGAYEFAAVPPYISPVVNSTSDGIDYLPGTLTLRQAISLANAQSTSTTISFDSTVFAAGAMHTINLSQGALPLTAADAISGPGNTVLTIDGQRDSGQSVFNIAAAATAAISGVTVTGSNASGITNGGNLTVSVSTISNNSGPNGGGINNTGILSIANCAFAGDSASTAGGGIYNTGSATVSNSTFTGDMAAHGGAINNTSGNLTLTNCTLAGDSANFDGGGILNAGVAMISASKLSSDSAPQGGGINNIGSMTITSSILLSDSATNFGAGIYNLASLLNISNSTFANNSATAQGGGIYNTSGLVTATNCTLSGNSAGSGGGIELSFAGAATLNNTIVANSIGGDIAGLTLNSVSSNNLIDDATGGLTAGINGNILNVPANLGPLANNGGPSPTFVLLAGSPAINAGNNNFVSGISTDQRGTGFPRITGGIVDIGAFEAGAYATATTITSSASLINYGQGVTFSATVTSSNGTPTGLVTFTDITTGVTLGTANLSGNTASFTTTSSYVLPAGPNTISAAYSISGNFNVSSNTMIQTVLPAPLTITTNPQNKIYGSVNPTLTGSVSGLVGADVITALYSTTATQFSNAGTYPITAMLSDPGNKLASYTVNYITNPLTINKANQTIVWAAPAAMISGTPLGSAQLNAIASGIAGGSAPGALTYTPGIGAQLAVGNQLLTATAAATTNYNSITASVALRVALPPAVGSVPPGATFLGTDTTTQGNWQTTYGADGYTIVNNKIHNPAYATVTTTGNAYYNWPVISTDPRALQLAGDYGSRIAAAYYSPTSMTIDVNISDDNSHQLSLYLVDYDTTTRSERIDILNAANGAVLNTQTASAFHGGQYLTWTVSGHVQIKITNLNPASNAVVSGLFFGSDTFLGSDMATQGNWTAAFGSDGQIIANTAAATPGYATVTSSGATTFTWAGSTDSVRALQQPATRIASAWYAPSTMTFDVNLSDGHSHTVSLYLLDWDANGRSERIDILNTFGGVLDTQTASSFSGGEYLSWNLSGNVQIRVTNLTGANAVVSGLFFSSDSFLGADTTTQGAWQGNYGNDGYSVDFGEPHAVLPSYAAVFLTGNSLWTWGSTADPRALQTPNSSTTTAAAWYTPTSMTFDVNLTDGHAHKLSLYALDLEAAGRTERIDILDASGNLLDSESIANFQNGQYLTWTLSGHVQIRVTNTGTTNAVISGLFFDPSPYVGANTSVQGSWQGKYGTDGYNLIGNAASYPSYAVVTPTGNTPYTWNTTTDSRVLQTPGSGTTNAAAWYTTTSMTIDVNLTDAHAHKVSLYLLDWGNAGRAERIDILDPSGNLLDSQTVANFQNGRYLSWTLHGDNQIRIITLAGANAVISGIFFDSATFLGTDTTTQGNWQGVYGNGGQIIPNNINTNPSYAAVSTAGTTAYTWSNSTTDPRALRQPNTIAAIASTWYTSTIMTINLNLTDGNLHKISLYLLDWDNEGRSEQIYILDASGNLLDTQTASSFQNGQYLSWNLSGQIQIRITCLAGANAVLGGLFFS